VASLTLQTLAVLWLGAFVGAVAVGGAGFAFALVATAIWLHALDPIHTTLLVAACGTVLHIGFIWPMRRSIEPRLLWPFLAGGIIGIPIGVRVLVTADPQSIKMVLGAFILIYGVYSLATPRLPTIQGGGRLADAAVGLAAGVLGGIGGYSGVLPTIWTQLRGWPKEVARGVYQPFILAAQLATFTIIGVIGLDATGLLLLAASLPALAAGAWVGWQIFGRLDERRFQQVLAIMLVASGLTLVL
jgi:uncharacterized protein